MNQIGTGIPIVAIAAALMVVFAAGEVAAQAAPTISGQAYPNKPVRVLVLVPLTPGGGADIIARVVSQRLTETMGQQFVVDNRPGAEGSVAYELLAKSAPDGHTLALTTGSMVSAQLMSKMPYDALRDFAAVSALSAQPYIFCINISLPARTVQEFVALAKARPRAFNYASSGIGGLIHLTGELFKWYGIITPARTPPDVVRALNREIVKALQLPAVKSRLEADGSEPTGSTPAAFDAFMRAEYAKWGKVIKAAGIKVD